MRVVVGVGGGIAAYKSCSIIRSFTEAGHHVRVVPTESALEFVGRATFEALSGSPVHTGVFADVPEVPHVRLGKEADLVVVAPATADLMARLAGGRADDLLTATLLTARCPVLLAPAMHTEMWEHPATVANVETLRSRGVTVLEPASGRLTGRDTGAGRLPDPDEIYGLALLLAERADALPRDLTGRKLVVTAGGTREPLDPVRFLGNRSSGKQGYALARVAAQRGADVTLISGYTASLADPAAVDVVEVKTAQQMQAAVASSHPTLMRSSWLRPLQTSVPPASREARSRRVRTSRIRFPSSRTTTFSRGSSTRGERVRSPLPPSSSGSLPRRVTRTAMY